MRYFAILITLLFADSLRANPASPVLNSQSLDFTGQFSEVQSTSAPCDGVFTLTAYDTKHFRVGSNGLTSVLYFEKGETPGFFSEVSIVGQYGYDNQIYGEKDLIRHGYKFHVISDGIVDAQVLLVELTVAVYDSPSGRLICQAKAEYFGQRK